MAMPTTRYGRYLFFRARQKRRLRRAYRAAPYYGADPAAGQATTGRRYALTLYEKQAPREYPKGTVGAITFWGAGWDYVFTPASYRQPPVFSILWFLMPDRDTLRRRSHEIIGFHQRRVKSIPRLKYVPRYGYEFPPPRPGIDRSYPYAVYPSGKPNPLGVL